MSESNVAKCDGVLDASKQLLKRDDKSEDESTHTDSNLSDEDMVTLGKSHFNRYRRLGDLNDLEKAVEYLCGAAATIPNSHPGFSHRLTNSALALSERFARLGRLEDLDKSIEHFSSVVGSLPDNHPYLSARLADLGMCFSGRFECLGKVEDLAKAVEHSARAVEMTPNSHPDKSRQLANLGKSYGYQFRCLGKLEYLEKAIDSFSQATKLISSDQPIMVSLLTDLGICLTLRFERLGELEDLAKAIEHSNQAIELTPSDHPDLSRRLASLGMSYDHRFRRLGELKDMDKSIGCFSRAVELLPDDHPNVSSWLANIAVAYTDRFKHLGEIEDLGKAIECSTRAIELTPNSHPDLPRQFFTLGICYGARSKHLSNVADIEQAIEHLSHAVKSTPTDHPDLPRRLSVLGMAYGDRYQYLDEPGDLEKSIEHESQATRLTPDGHPDKPREFANMGLLYTRRFQRLGAPEDLEKGIHYESRALALTSNEDPDLPFRQFNHATSYFLLYQNSGIASHLNSSLDLFRKACQSPNGAPRARFEYALKWADLASKHSALKCLEAYQTTINLLPQFIWLGATTSQRYRDLLMAKDLPLKATAAAILSSKHSLALEWLEHTRCVVLNQILMLRSPLDQLSSSLPDVATRLQTVANQLQRASPETQAFLTLSSKLVMSEHDAQERRRLAEEYYDLLTQTRQLPGFENFLLPIKTDRLIQAAKNGPIVAINCYADRCDALFIRPGQDKISHLSLPNFTEEKAQRARSELHIYLRQKQLRARGVKVFEKSGSGDRMGSVLAVLWTDVVKPVLEFLGYMNDSSGDHLPHLTWCLTGALSFLPLHAAGDYDQPQSRIFNYVISSYTPTLTALFASTPRPLDQTCRVLAIGQAATPGRSPLPGVVNELAHVKLHMQNKAKYSQLVGDQATTTAVLEGMEQSDWVHLACHAHQNLQDPTKSGFYLHNDTLDLVTINRQSFKNKGLAFLSACQTATGDEGLPDEAIHLASGMLMAGYPSVIATMWSVVDEDAPFVADKVYAELVKDGKIGNGEAGKALHHAVTALRGKVGERNFGRWVAYIHIGS